MQKRLTRSKDSVLAGVCAGIAKYFDLDPSMVRIAYLLVSVLSAAFPGILIYLILWFVIPEEEYSH